MAQNTNKPKGSYKKRLLTAGLVMLGLVFTVVFFGPLELVAFGQGSLAYTYQDVLGLLIVMSVIILGITAPLLALLRGKVFRITLSVFSGVSLAAYLQAMLLNGGLGLLTGDSIRWQEHSINMWVSGVLWVGLVTGLCLMAVAKPKRWKQLVRGAAMMLVIMQLVPTVTILAGAYDETKPTGAQVYYLSDRGIDCAGSENVYVFVLDRLDYDYIDRAVKVTPDLLEGLDGFTSYTNAVSVFARTKPALVNLLTGLDRNTYRVPSAQFYTDVWQQPNVLDAFCRDGWQVDLYSKMGNLFSSREVAAKYASNLSNGTAGLNYAVAAGKLLQLSAFRYSPTVAKPLFWADTNYFNTGILQNDYAAAYQYDDVGYARRLEQLEQTDGKQFKLIHFMGPHAPYTMNADGTLSQVETNVTAQLTGSFVNLKAIFSRMKELGIYEDATIIITGDHGAAVSDTKPLQKATRIGLFYKPSGSAGTPLQTSHAPVSVQNIPATLAKSAGLDYTALGTPLDEVAEDADLTRVYYKTVCNTDNYRESWLCTYYIIGDAANFKNWELVETVEIPYSYN